MTMTPSPSSSFLVGPARRRRSSGSGGGGGSTGSSSWVHWTTRAAATALLVAAVAVDAAGTCPAFVAPGAAAQQRQQRRGGGGGGGGVAGAGPLSSSSSAAAAAATATLPSLRPPSTALWARGRYDDDDDDDDEYMGGGGGDAARELSILEAEQKRIQAELEAARLKAQLAKLQQERGAPGAASSSSSSKSSSSSSSSKQRRDRDREREREEEEGGPKQPVSRRTGLQPAVPLSAKGPLGAAAKKKAKDQAAWGRDAPPKGWQPPASSTGGGGGKASFDDPEKEARYAEVVGELVSALQDVSRESGMDIKAIVRGIRAARDNNGGGGGAGGSGSSAVPVPAAGARAGFDEAKILEAMRKGMGNALVKRIIDDADEALPTLDPEDEAGRLERLAAWGSLVEKTNASSKYLLTADKVLGMKELADRLLPPGQVPPQDVAAAHLAAIREVGHKIADEYPEIRRRRGNMLYVLLNLPWASRGAGGNVIVPQEEVAIGQAISMEASLGLGCRAVFETTLAEAMPSSTEALSLMAPESFRRTTRALLEFGGLARQALAVTRMPAEDALKGVAFFLVPWLRRVAKRSLEDAGDEGVARLGMVMELGRYAAECMVLARAGPNGATSGDGFERSVQDMLQEKINGIGVELSSSARSTLLGGYVRSWVTECLMERSLPVPWADGEGRLRPGDIGAWDLARQVLTLSEMQLLFVAKETVPAVVGELMAEVFLDRGGEWPRGDQAFLRDFDLVYRRLKYDKYEGGSARCKAVRVMADKVLASRPGDEALRQQAVAWGCETLELGTEEFESLAREQATFELQTEILEGMLGPGGATAEEVAGRIDAAAAHLRLDAGSVRKATAAAAQVHIGNLAARALFADMEGQPMKAFKEVENTLRFIQEDAAFFNERFGCAINPTARIADEDGLQLANVCTKMISRRQFAEAARDFLEIIGYSDRIGY